ncbi:MAG: hypothetical protein HUU29_12765 [Planctomycetaceae bacterium]|nr:hypothetical protein [Planctomycetaceae bacterium]
MICSRAIFAIGGVALLALFLLHINDAAKAATANRALEIASSVRASLEASLRSPMTVQSGGVERTVYPFAFPFASLENLSPRADVPLDFELADNFRKLSDIPTVFFELPKKEWKGDFGDRSALSILPLDLMTREGIYLDPNRLDRDRQKNKVWYYKPTALTVIGDEKLDTETADLDDRDSYAFNILLRRSVMRAHRPPPGEGAKPVLPGLYVFHIRIFKGYDPSVTNEPVYEFDMTLVAPE